MNTGILFLEVEIYELTLKSLELRIMLIDFIEVMNLEIRIIGIISGLKNRLIYFEST